MILIPTKVDNEAYTPTKAYEGTSAAYDLRAEIPEPITLYALDRVVISTGVRLHLPEGTVGLVCPRSGIAVKKGITVLNSPGVVDSGYRGDVGVILFNSGEDPFVVQRGDRIAQLVVLPVLHPSLEFVESLDDTERGEGGFGSTGV